VEYVGYRSRAAATRRGPAYRALRACWHFIKGRMLYGILLFPYGKRRHRRTLAAAQRTQSHTYTCFFRAPAQLDLICGPLLDRVLAHKRPGSPLRILLFAASTGAEAYTLASVLLAARPTLDFSIIASDLHAEMVERGRRALYSHDEVWHGEHVTEEFVRQTFDLDGSDFVVKPEIAARVSFRQADLLDPLLGQQFGSADMVLAQNVLFHLDDAASSGAFDNVCDTLAPGAALLVEGMNLDQKMEQTRRRRLAPFARDHRRIYEQARAHVPLDWWNFYYGSEPYMSLVADRVRRYSTVFFSEAPPG
jgi:chemotaxis methyl-accepting protein methylase